VEEEEEGGSDDVDDGAGEGNEEEEEGGGVYAEDDVLDGNEPEDSVEPTNTSVDNRYLGIGQSMSAQGSTDLAIAGATGQTAATEGDDIEDGDEVDDHARIWDILESSLQRGLSIYPALGTNGYIGGVSSGRVVQKLLVAEDDETNLTNIRMLLPCFKNREICGGQVYAPDLKTLLLIAQRGDSSKLAGLPMLLMRTLLPTLGSLDTDRLKVLEKAKQLFDILKNILNQTQTEIEWYPPLQVRIELYFVSKLIYGRNDVTFPTIPFEEVIGKMNTVDLKKKMTDEISLYVRPLSKTLRLLMEDEKQLSRQYPFADKISPATKTMLVLCSEQLVTLVQVRKFGGRITGRIKSELPENTRFWYIPEHYKISLLEQEKELMGLEFGLDPALLRLALLSADVGQRTELNRLPNYMQQLRGQYAKLVHMPTAYIRFIGKVNRLLQWTGRDEDDLGDEVDEYQVGAFTLVPYSKIALLDDDGVKELLGMLAKLCWEAYDMEWWFIITEKTRQWARSPTSLISLSELDVRRISFPRTVNEFTTYRQSNGGHVIFNLSSTYNTGMIEITDTGMKDCAMKLSEKGSNC
jgi:hypothetical protein